MKKIAKFRNAELKERKEFYEKEFSVSKAKKWFSKNKIKLPSICAVDAGTETGIIIDKKYRNQMLYFPFFKLEEKIKKYLPEDIYYDRNSYRSPKEAIETLNFGKPISQELVFDIDSDNILCNHHKKGEVCKVCLNKAYRYTIKMKNALEKDFKKVLLVYSGRGFHIHVLDKKAFFMKFKERRILNEKFSRFPIDPWVSGGNIRLIRMPYTLNALVSRIVTPINVKIGFKERETIPKFLNN